MLTLMLLFTISGLLLACLSVPLILGKVGPNPLYGFRVRKTLDNPNIWYLVNAYAAKRLFVAAVVIVVTAVALSLVPDIELFAYAAICGAIGVAGILVAVIQSAFYLQSF